MLHLADRLELGAERRIFGAYLPIRDLATRMMIAIGLCKSFRQCCRKFLIEKQLEVGADDSALNSSHHECLFLFC
jgi:hypothetical protein